MTLLGEYFRKLSLILLLVSILVAISTEMWSDIPVGRGGRLKPPIAEQRSTYLILMAVSAPGILWAFIRLVRGKQQRFWD